MGCVVIGVIKKEGGKFKGRWEWRDLMMMNRRNGSFCGVLGAEGVSSSLVSSLPFLSFLVRSRESKMELKKIAGVLQFLLLLLLILIV